ncbi:MAG: response regulator [Planctomycetia bacterium]|nr:response regulator [Planctomycetia bacterium]
MSENNPIEKLREMAVRLLDSVDNSVAINEQGNNVRDLIQELSIYHIELEHQNRELERSEKELSESREEFIELFENAPVGYVIIDEKGTIERLNRTFIDKYVPSHLQDMQYKGHCFDEFVCPEFQNSFYLFCRMLAKTGVPVPLEIKLYNRFGAPQYVMITAGACKAGLRQFRLAISDISMQKRLESQLVLAKENAEKNDRQKSLFLTTVSHEICTPLTTILGFIDLIDYKDGISRNVMEDYIDTIKLSGKMLHTLVEEVLDLSSLETGTIPLRNENVDVCKICDEVVLLVQGANKDKNILIRNEVEKIPILWTDQLRLRQIIYSILSYAAGNATRGTVVITGRYVENEASSGFLVLEFTGKDIFSGESSLNMPFRNQSAMRNCEGLGLFLARQIIKLVNGEISWLHPLDSMRVQIPLDISHILVRLDPPDEHAPAPKSIPQRTCLLVDDVVMNLKVLDSINKLMNCSSTLASSAKEALELLKKNRYDFIMTDLWMPEMSGEELARTIRQNSDYNDIPIYAVTADVERENNFDMSYFAGTIIKPINIKKIRKLFESM